MKTFDNFPPDINSEQLKSFSNTLEQVMNETPAERAKRIAAQPKIVETYPKKIQHQRDFMCSICKVVQMPVEDVILVPFDADGRNGVKAGYAPVHCTPCDEPNTSNLSLWGKFVNWIKSFFKKSN